MQLRHRFIESQAEAFLDLLKRKGKAAGLVLISCKRAEAAAITADIGIVEVLVIDVIGNIFVA